MKPASFLFRTFLLAAFTLSLLAGAIFTDYYLRHEVTRKAKRFLAERGVELIPASAVEAARAGDLVVLDQLEVAGISLGDPLEGGETPLLAAVRANLTPGDRFSPAAGGRGEIDWNPDSARAGDAALGGIGCQEF